MEELHEMTDVIPNHMGTVKRRRSVQKLSKPQLDDSPPVKLVLGHNRDGDQPVAHVTEPRPLVEHSPRVVPFTPVVIESLEHPMSQELAAELINEVFHLATSVVKYLKETAKIENTPFLLVLLSQLCSITGIVFQLKEISQNETSEDAWNVKIATLCAPSGLLQNLALELRKLALKFAPGLSSSRHAGRPEPLDLDIDFTKIYSSFETPKTILLYALLNEPSAWSQAKEMLSTTIPDGDEGPVEPLESTAGDDNEHFLHWLVGDHKLSEISGSALTASSEKAERLLQSKEFEMWRTTPHSVLWLYGTAGSGKTTLCAKVVENIGHERCLSDGLAHFSFSTDKEKPENSWICLRSLISQLCEDNDKLPFAVQDMDTRRSIDGWGLADRFVLLEALELLVSRQRGTFIIIDAVEEASDSKEVVELLFSLAEKKLHGLHLVLSTRPELDIQEALDPLVTVIVDIGDQHLNAEISLYTQEYLENSPRWKRLDDADKRSIEGWLLNQAHGNLLWVTLCFRLLEDCPHLKDAKTFIQNLPKTIPGVYDRLLSSIPEAHKLEARQALQWMAVSERPLYLKEIAEAAMLELPGSSNPGVRLSTPFEIAEICAGLVSLVPARKHETYREKMIFVHHTLKEYLLSGNIGSPEAAFFAIPELEAQKLISYVSLGYLLSAIEDAPLSIMERANFPLLEYVLKNWYKHMEAVQKFVPVPEPTLDRAVKLFDAIYARRRNGELDRPMSKGPEGPEALYLEGSNFPPPLYYASRLGLVDVVQKLLLRGDQHQDSGEFFGTPLQAAAYGGHWPVIKELVEKGADVNAVSGFYGTALQAASYSGQYYTSCVLLEYSADVNSLSGHYGTPLQAAAYGGHAELMDLLFLYRAKINTGGGFYGSALVAAIQGGHEDVAIMLIKNGARSVNADGNTDVPNALYRASAKGYRTVVAKLLDYGADPNKDCEFGRSALEAAIQGGYSDVVELLTQKMATLNRASSMGLNLGGSALHMAAQGGHRDLAEQLLRRQNINVNYQDKDGLSPLMIAVSRGHETVLRLLLEEGVDRTLTDKDGLTALMMAVIGGQQGLVVLLLKHEAGVNARNNHGKTPLMFAVEEGHEAIVYLLLQHGATIEAPDRSGITPIDVAVSKGYQIIEKLLGFGESGTAIADREEFWKIFSRIQMHLDEQDCPSSS